MRGVDTLREELLATPLELGVELLPPKPTLPDGPKSKHLDSIGAVISCATVSGRIFRDLSEFIRTAICLFIIGSPGLSDFATSALRLTPAFGVTHALEPSVISDC